jgi:uncharacterized lipoprotein YmbA
MHPRHILAIGSLTLLLAACASAPTRFHTLDPVPPAAAAAGRALAPPVRLDSVTLPAELDRPQIVRRAGPGNLDVADDDRWAGPLDEIARHALATDLAQRLPPGSTIRPDDPAPPKLLRGLDVEIDRFEGDLAGGVVLAAHWTLLDSAGNQPAASHEERIEIPAGGAAIDATVAGMSGALGLLADRIAAAVSGH